MPLRNAKNLATKIDQLKESYLSKSVGNSVIGSVIGIRRLHL